MNVLKLIISIWTIEQCFAFTVSLSANGRRRRVSTNPLERKGGDGGEGREGWRMRPPLL